MTQRIIKFRCWSKSKKCWFNPPFSISEGLQGEFELYIPATDMFGEAVLQQWTGLLDSKGVEIWEGDVVKFGSYSGVVGFESGKFVVAYKTKPVNEYADVPSRCEVIGNVWESPELLKD